MRDVVTAPSPEVLIARCAPSAVGPIDPSEGMLSQACTRVGCKPAEFRVGDAQALPYLTQFRRRGHGARDQLRTRPMQAAREMARVVAGRLGASYMRDLSGGGLPSNRRIAH
jgi:hypothetical protein